MKAIQERLWEKIQETIDIIQKDQYDPEIGLVWAEAGKLNYHSAVSGGRVHNTRENLSWLPALLKRGNQGDYEIAVRAIPQVLALQDKDEENSSYGIWPYLFEEPLSEMKNPDWNWAGFLGASLAVLLEEDRDLLPAELVVQMEEALVRACESIIRRDMGVDYTNISLMSAAVLVLAGELLGREDLWQKGQRILEEQLEFVLKNGGFAEYNSPTYGVLDVEETGRILKYTQKEETRNVARQLHNLAWKVFAEHYHPATGQVAGPHARCYQDIQDAAIRTMVTIGTDGACPLEPYESWQVGIQWPFMVLECPRELWHYFGEQTETRVLEEDFYKGVDTIGEDQIRVLIEKGTPALSSYTYFRPDYCLGSFARHDLWNQRRPLTAYFQTEHGAVCFRARCMHDDMDFSSAILCTRQHEGAIIGNVSFVTDHGDYHYILTPLVDGKITAGRFSLDFLVEGASEAVRVRALEPVSGTETEGSKAWRFAMDIGKQTLYLNILAAQFGSEPVRVEVVDTDQAKGLRLILWEGEDRVLDFNKLDRAFVSFWMEIAEAGQAPATAGSIEEEDGKLFCRLTENSRSLGCLGVEQAVGRYICTPPGEEKEFLYGGFRYRKTKG